MKTTCAMVMDSLAKMKSHLEFAHGMRPEFHITVTQECRADLLSDPEAIEYIPFQGYPDTICGHGFSVVVEQDQPYRIWIAGRLQ